MMRSLLAAVSIGAAWLATADARAERVRTPAAIEFPNGVAALPDGSVLAGGGGNGAIWRLGADGRWSEFAPERPGLPSISSLRLDPERNILWAAAPDIRGAFSPGSDPRARRVHRVFALDLMTGALRFSAAAPDGGFANDLALDGEGGAYLTDSLRGRIWRVSADGRFTIAAEDPRFLQGALGPSGVARLPGGDLIVGLFSAGELYRVIDPGPKARVARVSLERPLVRPDGLAALPDGSLLVIEGGRGALQRLDLRSGRLTTVAAGLDGPVNLSVRGAEVWVTESGVNEPAAFDPARPPRERFALQRIDLGQGDGQVVGELPLPSGFHYPNGVARASDGTLYVGLVTSGRILRRMPEGAWSVFFPGSDAIYASTSLRLDEARGLLWGTSPDFLPGAQARPHRVFALDARSGAVRRLLTLPDEGFGNDIAVLPDGGLYVTDSRMGRLLRLRPGAERFEIALEHPDLRHGSGIGAAGIAHAGDGRLVIGNYGAGRLFVIEGLERGSPALRRVALPRALDNPDGLAFAPDGALILTEGAVRSGDGRVMRIPDPFAAGERSLETLRAGLPSPVNLTIAPDGTAFITLSRVRHRLLSDGEGDVPDRFGVLPLPITTVRSPAL